MSFGTSEYSTETSTDAHFKVANVAFVASSGDAGHGVEYPAASPYVIGVGGTSLYVLPGATYLGELAWTGSGGGLSQYEPKPAFQQNLLPVALLISKNRGVPDVAYDADPSTGVAVYDTYGNGGWMQVGGTSAGAPQWAALLSIANAGRQSVSKSPLSSNAVLQMLYSPHFTSLHDIVFGSNGTCGGQCSAKKQYDFVTGEGSPKAQDLVLALEALP
jgi:subtilase family serine protease